MFDTSMIKKNTILCHWNLFWIYDQGILYISDRLIQRSGIARQLTRGWTFRA